MAKIYISTNGDKPKNLYTNDQSKENVEAFLIKNGFDTIANNIEREVFKDVVLISDELHSLTTEINSATDYLLYHNVTKSEIVNLFDRKTPGNHMIGDQYKYQKVFDILLSEKIEDETKAKLIIEYLFPTADIILGKKLDLLHNLLVPPIDFITAQNHWNEIKNVVKKAKESGIKVSLASDENALNDFEKSAKGLTDPFEPNYLEALRTLRDQLLDS